LTNSSWRIDQARVSHPAAVEAVGGVAGLVVTMPAMALSLASGSFLIGISALMPPMAGAPRLWQVLQQQRVGAHEGHFMVTWRALGQAEVLVFLNFLMQEKM
jgi:hypothetical protein